MVKRKRYCLRCGTCCRKQGFGWSPEINDLKRWLKQSRLDILQYINICLGDNLQIRGDELTFAQLGWVTFSVLWVNPPTGKRLKRCPFLRKTRNQPVYTCLIHDTKPNRCRAYRAWDMVFDDGLYDHGYQCCKGIKRKIDPIYEVRVEDVSKGYWVIKVPEINTF